MIKIGLLGFGFMGSTHYKIYGNIPGARVVGIYDLDPEKVKSGRLTAGNIGSGGGTIDLSGVRVTDNPEELINSPDIDMLDVCLPTYMHSKYSVKALESGKHTFCEKPMALSADECETMIKCAKKAGKKFMIGQCIRFWPEYAFTKDIVDKKKYGRVISAFFRRVSPIVTWSCNNWILEEAKSGGSLMDLHIHDTDYVLYLFGKPKQVQSFGSRNSYSKTSGYDYTVTRYAYNDSLTVIAEGGWHFHPKFPFNMSFTIRCEKATIVFDSGKEKSFAIYHQDGSEEFPQVLKSTGWDEELKYFIDCVANNRKIEVSRPEDSKMSVKLVLAEKTSMEKKKPVKIV